MSNKKKLKAVSIMLLLIMIASVLGGCTLLTNFKDFCRYLVVGDDNTIISVYMNLVLENLKRTKVKRKSRSEIARILFIM